MDNKLIAKPFDLLRWFSIASLLALLPVAGATAFVLSYFMTEETLQRDAGLTAQFIQNCLTVEALHVGLGQKVALAEIIDERVDPTAFGVSPEKIEAVRNEVFDHLKHLPDSLLTNLYARDRRIIWSSNPELIGTDQADNHELDEAFQARSQVARHHPGSQAERAEQKFIVEPKDFFIENYIPLHDARGQVVLVAEVYKEPHTLHASIRRGEYLVWGSTAIAGALVYLALFSIIRRGSSLLQAQQKQLVEMDSLAYMGEMATAVAHGLRNPLASIRSSAELAIGADPAAAEKNARDIISQVDVLSKWIRQLLLFTRPVTAEPEPVDLVAVLAEVLDAFAASFAKFGIRLVWPREESLRPCVEGNAALLTQVLHTIVANAVEAMPKGGELRIDFDLAAKRGRCLLSIRDTGIGMTEKQLALAFKPFHTNKRHGLGVGLAMVKRVMARFGGPVALSSRENEGTELRLEFTLA